MDLLAGGGIGHVLLGGATHVELVDLSQELLGLWWVCGGGVVCHTVQPAMPEGVKKKKKKVAGLNNSGFQAYAFFLFMLIFVFDYTEVICSVSKTISQS